MGRGSALARGAVVAGLVAIGLAIASTASAQPLPPPPPPSEPPAPAPPAEPPAPAAEPSAPAPADETAPNGEAPAPAPSDEAPAHADEASASTHEAPPSAPPADAAPAAPAPAPQPPRPPPLPPLETSPPPWRRHIEIGGDFAVVERPSSRDREGRASTIRYAPAVGFGLHARWPMLEYLRFTAYFVDAHHAVAIRQGELSTSGLVLAPSVRTFVFGARLSPTLPFGPRGRIWASVGAGWGRLELERMRMLEADATTFIVREQSATFAEVPFGLGGSFDVIPRWLAVEVEVTGAVITGQDGDLFRGSQAIDAYGKKRSIGGFPEIDASFVQTLGLSLLL